MTIGRFSRLLIALCAVVVAACKPSSSGGNCSYSPGHEIDVAIITVISAEYQAMRAHFDCDAPAQMADNRTNTFAWRGARIARDGQPPLRVVLALAGEAGTTSGALATLETLRVWQPRAVVLAGVAGGFEDYVSQGDVVVTRSVWGFDYGSIGKSFLSRRDWIFQPDARWFQLASAYDGDWQSHVTVRKPILGPPPVVHTGITASGNKVIESMDSAFVQQLLEQQPDISSVEMEAAGAFAALELLRQQSDAPPLLMLRGISDIPTPASNLFGEKKERELWKAYAADTVAAFTTSFLRDTGVPGTVEPRTGEALDALLITSDATICEQLAASLGVQQRAAPSTTLGRIGSRRVLIGCVERPVAGDTIDALLRQHTARAVVLVDTAVGIGKSKPNDVVVGRQWWPFRLEGSTAKTTPILAIRHSRALVTAAQAINVEGAFPVAFGAIASGSRLPADDDIATGFALLDANPRTRAVDAHTGLVQDAVARHAGQQTLFVSVQGIDHVIGLPPVDDNKAAANAANVVEHLLKDHWPQ
ncbi:MAG: hypothetical protein AAF290_14100 [Pseudomonadota bacterium]